MIKIFLFAFLLVITLQSNCTSYNPVCGDNGVTYNNICQCREARVDVGYYGACNTSSPIEWVKKIDE